MPAQDSTESCRFLELYTEEYRQSYENWKAGNADAAQAYISEYLLGSPRARSRGGYASPAVEAFNAAVTSQRDGDAQRARELYLQALGREPRMLSALANLSILHMQDQEYEKARPVLAQWIVADKGAAQPLAMMAQVESRAGNLTAARALLEKAIKLEKDASVKSQYERILVQMQDASERPPAVTPTSPPPNPTRAATSAPKAVAPPDAPAAASPAMPLAKAAEALANRDPKRVIELLKEHYPQLPEGPNKIQAALLLGLAHYRLQQWEESRFYIGQVLERDPSNWVAQDTMRALKNIPQR